MTAFSADDISRISPSWCSYLGTRDPLTWTCMRISFFRSRWMASSISSRVSFVVGKRLEDWLQAASMALTVRG